RPPSPPPSARPDPVRPVAAPAAALRAPQDSGHSPADWRSSARRPRLPGDSSRRALVSPASDGANARIVRPGARRACAVTPPRGGEPLHWRRMDDADVIVVGAGVVGLAVARELALRGREVLILEAAGRFGTGASSRNSEVIHAGIHYPRGSLKARLCVAGRERLYEFCRERSEEHTSELQSRGHLVCRLLLEKKKCRRIGLS